MTFALPRRGMSDLLLYASLFTEMRFFCHKKFEKGAVS